MPASAGPDWNPRGSQPAPSSGLLAAAVRDEHPGLRLSSITVGLAGASASRAPVALLRQLSDRFSAQEAIAMRTKGVAHAYRAFFRQVGLDPDIHRIPSEQAAVERMLAGGWRSKHPIGDACLVALIETGVAVWALDADRLDRAGLGIRVATELDAQLAPVAPGTLVIADGTRACAQLFCEPFVACAAGPGSARATLFAVAVDGVSELHVQEALFCARELL
ncbi:MAG: hypothetical protein ACRDMX_00450 [Solirubrobacteraceae bacterium]